MPESTHQENDEGIPYSPGLAVSGTSQRDIEVVLEPTGQGYMPSAPELGDIPGIVTGVKLS